MFLIDANVLLYALREDAPKHAECHDWFEALVNSGAAYGISELVLSAVVRIATHPSIFNPPTPLERVLEFCTTVREQPNCVIVNPGPSHWSIFTRLCREAAARGNLVPDAYLAALALESGCELVSTDRDFSRFSGLRWSPP